jgi:hypothetical protein
VERRDNHARWGNVAVFFLENHERLKVEGRSRPLGWFAGLASSIRTDEHSHQNINVDGAINKFSDTVTNAAVARNEVVMFS